MQNHSNTQRILPLLSELSPLLNLATPDLVSIPIILPFSEYHINEIIQ